MIGAAKDVAKRLSALHGHLRASPVFDFSSLRCDLPTTDSEHAGNLHFEHRSMRGHKEVAENFSGMESTIDIIHH